MIQGDALPSVGLIQDAKDFEISVAKLIRGEQGLSVIRQFLLLIDLNFLRGLSSIPESEAPHHSVRGMIFLSPLITKRTILKTLTNS
jgi:hypothetical protein